MIPGTPFIPGPWFVSKRRKRICTQTGTIVAHVHNPPCRMNGDAKRLAREQAIATAHLIAAAPDLYAALIETLEIAARNEDGDFRIRARNALAKARPLTETEILYTPLEDLAPSQKDSAA